MYVCLCVPVSDREVRSAIEEGADTLEELGTRCGAGTGCGGCIEELRALLHEGSGAPANTGGRRAG